MNDAKSSPVPGKRSSRKTAHKKKSSLATRAAKDVSARMVIEVGSFQISIPKESLLTSLTLLTTIIAILAGLFDLAPYLGKILDSLVQFFGAR